MAYRGATPRAGRVRFLTRIVPKVHKKKKPRGRAHKRMQYNRRFGGSADGFGNKRGRSKEGQNGKLFVN
ncbi:Ribosomal protein S30 family protein [Euphorbia peplus]|nr:Ribosomal protein S30 family protein [Euphorbia peplus]